MLGGLRSWLHPDHFDTKRTQANGAALEYCKRANDCSVVRQYVCADSECSRSLIFQVAC